MASEAHHGEYEEVCVDMLGQEFLRGPTDRQVALIREVVKQVGARWLGLVLAGDGLGQEGLLGMLESDKFGLNEAIEGLVMHGALDDDRADEQPTYSPSRDENVLIIRLPRESRKWEQFPEEQIIDVQLVNEEPRQPNLTLEPSTQLAIGESGFTD